MIKVIASDMDGTLLNSAHEISEGNRNAIKKAINKGVLICVELVLSKARCLFIN